MPLNKEELSERAQLVRVYEASCHIQYPTDQEKAFREATMKRVAKAFNYAELKSATITAPATTASKR